MFGFGLFVRTGCVTRQDLIWWTDGCKTGTANHIWRDEHGFHKYVCLVSGLFVRTGCMTRQDLIWWADGCKTGTANHVWGDEHGFHKYVTMCERCGLSAWCGSELRILAMHRSSVTNGNRLNSLRSGGYKAVQTCFPSKINLTPVSSKKGLKQGMTI